MLWQAWWMWVGAGIAFGILEVLLPAYLFLGLAIGAVLVGAFLALGILGGSLPVLLVVFSLASLIAWIALRRSVGVRAGQVKHWDRDIND